MTRDELRAAMLRVLGDVAPECNPSSLQSDVSLRDQLDLDSMDFQSFVIGLHQQLRVEIPERDYPKFATLDSAVDYLLPKLTA